MKISTLGLAEIPKLKKLHDRTFNQEYPYRYFAYLFKNPFGVVPMGMYDGDRLIGFYCGKLRKFLKVKYAACSMAMIDPDYSGNGLIIELAKEAYLRMREIGCKFLTFFVAIDKMRKIYEKYLDFTPIQMKKYWTGINSQHFHPEKFIRIYESADPFKNYRYLKHPTTKYEMYLDMTDLNYLILNKYDNQLQMIDFSRLTPRIVEQALMVGAEQGCEYLTIYYPTLPDGKWIGKDTNTWFCYKQLDPEFPNWETKYFENVRMGMTDKY